MIGPDRLEELTPRELGMGLMRGKRDELQGYNFDAAILAVLDLRGEMEENDLLRLTEFLRGFQFGLNRIDAKGVDHEEFEREFEEGYTVGLEEPPTRTYPASIPGDHKLITAKILTVPDGENRG